MITRLDPDLPLCWEDEHTLRVGFERALARVRRPSAGAQRFIGSLTRGIDADGIGQEARRVGATSAETRELLSVLRPALVTRRADRASASSLPLRTLICDDGREPPGLRAAILASGLCALDFTVGEPDLVIVVERFLEPMHRAHRWFTRGIPHLLIRFTDQAAHIGPLVIGDGSPCHSCLTLRLLASDPAFPVLAAQLSGATPPSEQGVGVHGAAAIAATFVRGWLDGEPWVHRSRAVLPVRGGRAVAGPTVDRISPHPDCDCGAFRRAAAPDPPRR